MTVQILYDNQGVQSSLDSGWGFSCLVGGEVLFDTGESGPALLRNMRKLGISADDISAVVLSHAHWDHYGGIADLLALRPELPIYIPDGAETILADADWMRTADVTVCAAAVPIGPFRTTGTFAGSYKGSPMPEQALAVAGKKGVSLITGCAHPGILTMAQRFVADYAEESCYALLGGMHLLDLDPDAVGSHVARLRQLGFQKIIATHCSGEAARELSDYRTGVGDIIAL